jgi:dipeptidyl aminopeptidase/acylaminoacyl peptidase
VKKLPGQAPAEWRIPNGESRKPTAPSPVIRHPVFAIRRGGRRSALALLLLVAGCAVAQAPAPQAITTEGVPPIPAGLSARLQPYLEPRGAAFEDWGPDGSILFTRRAGNTSQLFLMRNPGERPEQLTRTEEPVSGALHVGMTGDVFFSQSRGGDENYQIYRLNLKSREVTLLTDGRSRNGMGTLSRKGDRLLHSSNRRNGRDTDLYLMDIRTGKSEVLIETDREFIVGGDWSPDDSKLALLTYVSANESRPFVLDVSSRKRTPIPIPGGVKAAHGSIKFAQDGRHVVLATDARGEFRQPARVDLQTLEYTGSAGLMARPIPWDFTDIEIHGDRAAFVTNEDGASRLYLSAPDHPVDLPAGVLSGLRFSPDGSRLAFTLSRADAPADVYTYEIATRRLACWKGADAGALDVKAFVVPERISFKSFDGREIPAYVYRPRREGRAPVLVSIHGGPESQYRPEFSAITQFHVKELGCAVIAPNVRGSSGYGKTYVALDNAQKREDAVRDIGALLDWIATRPDLDPSRVAVIGGSYGGYMVLASLVHHGERLKAGIDVVGIANFVTFLEKTSGYRVDLRRAEYGDEREPGMRAFFEKISPANHAEQIKSALLVAHGRNDPRVPFFEAEQIAAKVRARGRPVWTVYADNEGHGFAKKENRDYLSAAIALFLEKHLRE